VDNLSHSVLTLLVCQLFSVIFSGFVKKIYFLDNSILVEFRSMAAAESVVVAIRWRPLIKRELANGSDSLTDWTWTDTSIKATAAEREWTFDKVRK
jgi:hypothetical protein